MTSPTSPRRRRGAPLALPLLVVALGACDTAGTDGPGAAAAAGGAIRPSTVFATLNPAGAAQDGLLRLSGALDVQATYGGFTGLASVESVAFSPQGDAWLTVDLSATTGGLLVVERVCDPGADGCEPASGGTVGEGDRLVAGPATGLVAPKGLVHIPGHVVVADFGARDVKVFRVDATGDTAPAFVVRDLGGTRSVWDVAYDPQSDRMFVAGTDGAVLVYDRFLRNRGARGPSRIIVPADANGTPVSVNLHGIAYDRASRTLVLSDVGNAASATDGQLFTVANADRVSGNVPVRYRNVGGPQLGNPVDLELMGGGAYVAEKANDRVLFYAGILSRTGTEAAVADDAVTVTKPESVDLAPALTY